MDTAKFCLFIDKLFDSVNSSSTNLHPGKELRRAVTYTSNHWKFWEEAIVVLRSMQLNKKIPSIKNWISTIKGFQYLCKKLLNSGFKFITLRSFNQDPIENFFCQVRSHGFQNTNPTCFNFQCSFKSLFVNNCVSIHSVGANCQEGFCKNLANLKQLLTLNVSDSNTPVTKNLLAINVKTSSPVKSKLALMCQSYVAGAVVNKIKKKTSNCKFCIEVLKSENVKNNEIIKTRQYINCTLQTPSIISANIYGQVLSEFNSYINITFHEPHIKYNFINSISPKIKMNNLCTFHDTKSLFLNYSFDILIFAFTSNVNRLLKGEKLKMLCSEGGKILHLAEYYYKHFKLKKHKILKNCNKL